MHSPFVPGRSQRLKWWWEDLRAARFSLGLSAFLILIEALLSSRGGASSPSLHAVYGNLGLSNSGILSGKIWQPATHAFVHGGWTHVLLNVLLLLGTGARVERIADGKTAARIFVAGTLAGGAMFLMLPVGDFPLVGASGGIFALLLWLTTVSPGSRMAPVPVSARNFGLGILMATGAMALISPWYSMPGMLVSHACHFGGAMAGWLMARRWMRVPVVRKWTAPLPEE
jgi:membrane associated rhomboid family serine protease